MADHQPKGIFPATRKVQQQRKTAAAIKQLVGNNNNSVFKKFEARKSFALPSWVNLTEMGILAARPHLAKLESWRLLNAAKSAKERIRKQQAALTAKAFGVKNEVIKTNNTKNSTNKIVKSLKMTSSNTSIPHKSAPPLAKTTPSEKEKLTLTKSFSSSVFPSSPTSPPTSLYNMKFTQIWTKKKSETTTIKTTLDNINNITLKKQANEEDKSSTETVIDPKSWEDIDALVPLTQKKELANSPTNQTNKKHQKITTASTTIKTTLFPKLQTKQNNLNKTKTVIRHSGQTVMKQLETQKKRVEITLESSKHSFNNQTIIPFSSLSSNLTKNHFHLSGVKTIKTTKNSKELNKKSTKNPSKNQKINNLPNKLINSREELEHLRNALLKNLEKFLKNKGKVETKNTKQKRFIEPPSILFYSKEDSERMGLNLNHCSLFINCKAYLEQLKSSKLNCSDSLFPLIETKNKNNPKRRRSASERCNARLLPLFKRAEMATNELERETLKCVENSLKEKNKPIKSSIKCHQNWPLLTPLFPQLNCSEKIIRLQHHCENLGKCCSNLKNCQEQINSTGLSRRIQIEKQRLTQRSEQCELQANEMFNNISG
uniref:Uncharacterized protein n=1 Tax=Meloidogyne hapla TaxID=6305 RepID=A0A1I8B107_MELHA